MTVLAQRPHVRRPRRPYRTPPANARRVRIRIAERDDPDASDAIPRRRTWPRRDRGTCCYAMWNPYAMVTDARIAPRRIRLLAGVIDMAAGLLGMVAVMIVTVGASLRVHEAARRQRAVQTQSAWNRWGVLAVDVVARGAAGRDARFRPGGRNRRGPGYRVRFASGRCQHPWSGQHPQRRRGRVVRLRLEPATNSRSRPHPKREMERMTALRPQLEEIQREYPADAEARQQPLIQFYKTNRVSPLPAFTWSLLASSGGAACCPSLLTSRTDDSRSSDAHAGSCRPVAQR